MKRIIFSLLLISGAFPVFAADSLRDGRHDFDFNLGTWRTQIKRLQHPLSGANDWTELDGTVTVRKLWEGGAQLEEIEADGNAGHFEGLTLFLYNPRSHQWTMSFANSADGDLDLPGTGEFSNGRGEFIQQDTYQGRSILVRFIWSDITPDAHHVEQSFSADGGKTWEPNFVANPCANVGMPVSNVKTRASCFGVICLFVLVHTGQNGLVFCDSVLQNNCR
jgi:hypothetical protein